MKKWILIVAVALSMLAALMIGATATFNQDAASPPNTADLVPERTEVADADNAYTHFNAAAKALVWPKGDSKEAEWIDEMIDGEADHGDFAADFLARNEQALTLLDRGLGCRICQPPAVTHICGLQLDVVAWKDLGRLFSLKIAHEKRQGRYTEATTTCCKLLRFGNLIQHDAVDIGSWLLGTVMLRSGLSFGEELATLPKTNENDLAALAAALAEIESVDRGFVRGIKAHYQMVASEVDNIQEKQKRASTFAFHPNKTKQALADYSRDRVENASRAWADVNLRDPADIFRQQQSDSATAIGVNSMGKMLYDLSTEGMPFDHRCELNCQLAATRLIVACKRYEKANGQLPPTLDDLTPEYLDAVPTDPYDGKPFRYDRDKRIVYAVGKDLIDSGGSTESDAGHSSRDNADGEAAADDVVSYIDGERPGKRAGADR